MPSRMSSCLCRYGDSTAAAGPLPLLPLIPPKGLSAWILPLIQHVSMLVCFINAADCAAGEPRSRHRASGGGAVQELL